MKATQEINADGVTNSQIFINKFEASTTYGDEGGLNVTKTLNGRTLAADMFDFTITGEATDSVTAEEAEAKLAETDKSFKNTAPGKDDVAVMSKLSDVKFDETDIGKTYQYSVREAAGTDTKYTYDQVSATVAITVQEKDGELYTVTTVTKGDDSKEYSSAESKATAVAPFVNSYTQKHLQDIRRHLEISNLRSPERSSSMLRSSQAVSPVLRTIRKRKELWL